MIEISSLTFLSMAVFFGLTAGISPGPLLTIVISETLKHNRHEGFKVAMAPLITDLPIILVTWFIFSGIYHFSIVLGIISFSGGIYFIFLGCETMKIKSLIAERVNLNPQSLKKGIAANFLNPNPYIFWLTAGIPTAFKAYETSLLTVILYFLLFYLMLIGSKIVVALLVERSKSFLSANTYSIVMKILGIVLFLFATLFIYNGIETFRK